MFKFVWLILATTWLIGHCQYCQNHQVLGELEDVLKNCSLAGRCEDVTEEEKLLHLSIRLANDYSSLLLPQCTISVIQDILKSFTVKSNLSLKLKHILSVTTFSIGEQFTDDSLEYSSVNKTSLSLVRSMAAHSLLAGTESIGISQIKGYISLLDTRLQSLLLDVGFVTVRSHAQVAQYSDDYLLEMLLSEAQGITRLHFKLSDLVLLHLDKISLDGRQRFQLGVGLAKLGLFDLSLRHVSLSASPWEAPLYRFRAKLMFSPVHYSIRSLAQAVDVFVRQAESILLLSDSSIKSDLMSNICNSPNEVALALQSLPLLHLAAFAAPRDKLLLGHMPVGLPALLSEVYMTMCPPKVTTVKEITRKRHSRKLRIGIVAGSFDSSLGRIIVGLLADLKPIKSVSVVAMCFPTPRDALTDKAIALVDGNVNLSPHNKSQAIERIMDSRVDFILFADPALDSRVFALAHERLAKWQGVYWGWGGSLRIPTLDFYLIPYPLWSISHCPIFGGHSELPQELFHEQVILLEGLPMLPLGEEVRRDVLWEYLNTKFLLKDANQSHIYMFPGTVKHLHPEFDSALAILLKTDPFALVIVCVPRNGRDNLPTTHIAVRHDLMHPAMPLAAVAKLRQRMQSSIGLNYVDRIRVLPPLEDKIFRALRRASVAVLDPFPVGFHVQVIDALMDKVPVVSAPLLQECTNSHANSISSFMQIGPHNPAGDQWAWPSTPEEYAVLAMKLQSDVSLRNSFLRSNKEPLTSNHGQQLMQFLDRLID